MINIFLFFLMLLLLILLSIEDIKSREVSDVYTLSFAALCLTNSHTFTSAIIGAAIIGVAIFVDDKFIPMGSGDIIIYGAFYAYFGLERFLFSVILVGALSITAFYVEKAIKTQYLSNGKGIVGMPFFFLSFLIINFIWR